MGGVDVSALLMVFIDIREPHKVKRYTILSFVHGALIHGNSLPRAYPAFCHQRTYIFYQSNVPSTVPQPPVTERARWLAHK